MDVRNVSHTIDKETGEVLYASETDMTFYLYTPQGYLLHNNRTIVRVTPELPLSRLTGDAQSKLFAMLPLIDGHNAIMRRDRPNKPMTPKFLSEFLDLSTSSTYRLIKALKDAAIIREYEDTWYANPLYLMAANRLTPELYRIFRPECDKALPDWALQKLRGD